MQTHGPKNRRLLSAAILLLFLYCAPKAALADANQDDIPVKSRKLQEIHPIEKEEILQELEKIVEKKEKLEISEKEENLDSGMEILVTGGAGFIGSHTVVELLEAGHHVTVIDDCSNTAPPARVGGIPPSLERVQQIVGPLMAKRLKFVLGDVTDPQDLDFAFGLKKKHAVIHFAGLKAVGESKEKPLSYYRVNQGGSVALLEAMERANCTNIIFSSSATVYQPAKTIDDLPLSEDSPTGGTTNPYARSKLHVEEILADACVANSNLSVVNLRYFNPVGAHESGLIGEDPRGIPNNLMPYVSQVAIGRRPHLNVFGSDYQTHDGTGMRDYIHVVDLAKGHLAAMRRFNSHTKSRGFESYNLGTGQGTSVLELVKAFREASGKEIPTVFTERRAGDVAWLWCAPNKALKDLDWKATRDISDMCRDMWRFQSMNPSGYVTDNSEERESNMSSEISDDDLDESKRSDSGLSSDEDNATILPKLKFTMSPAKSIFHRYLNKLTSSKKHHGL